MTNEFPVTEKHNLEFNLAVQLHNWQIFKTLKFTFVVTTDVLCVFFRSQVIITKIFAVLFSQAVVFVFSCAQACLMIDWSFWAKQRSR